MDTPLFTRDTASSKMIADVVVKQKYMSLSCGVPSLYPALSASSDPSDMSDQLKLGWLEVSGGAACHVI